MMPFYPMTSLRSGYAHYLESPPSDDASIDDDNSDGGSDSVRSVPSPMDDPDLYDFDVGRSNLSDDIGDYLHVEGSSGSELRTPGSGSPTDSVPPRLVPRFRDLGLDDSELTDPADYLSHEGDGDTHETESDGELSNVSPADDDDDFEEVPNPPELPSVQEDRLKEVWPLGDASFNIFLCPITHDVMTDPVVSADGYTYERIAIARWFETSRKSPVTGQSLPHTDLAPNHSVRTLLRTLIDMTEPGRQSVGSPLRCPGALSGRSIVAPVGTLPSKVKASGLDVQACGSQVDVASRGATPILDPGSSTTASGSAGSAYTVRLNSGGGASSSVAAMACTAPASVASLQRSPPTPNNDEIAGGHGNDHHATAREPHQLPVPWCSLVNGGLGTPSVLAHPQPLRLLSQPVLQQPILSTTSGAQTRPSSSGSQYRPQPFSTALPPLRGGHTAAASASSSGDNIERTALQQRGAVVSPPLVVPPLSQRLGSAGASPSSGSGHDGRAAPRPPPFPPPSPPESSQSAAAMAIAAGAGSTRLGRPGTETQTGSGGASGSGSGSTSGCGGSSVAITGSGYENYESVSTFASERERTERIGVATSQSHAGSAIVSGATVSSVPRGSAAAKWSFAPPPQPPGQGEDRGW
eukprot:TRINITY_DN50511_c0_g1_i1.p1 TRINITY_DN50511_c0_g1~~TRINITY_DN50511_c0_g1_i1.p1  ORF type:complete len:637 (+),score=88.69 TRINITY_DN50511_c0_g1_i1:298-2208(+)